MAKYLDENGLATQISIEKATFISKSDVQEVEVDSSPTANSTNLVTSGGVKTAVDSKQDALVSGTNIKTINNESLLGSGNITINADTSACELLANKVTSISSSSTDTQYPSALCVYNLVGDIETLINAL